MAGSSPSAPGASPPPTAKRRRGVGAAVAAVIVVIIVVVAALYFLKIGPFSSGKTAAASQAGGFTSGQVVTFVYTGNFECVPSLAVLFPSEASVNSTTSCEVGAAHQNAVVQVPQWVLVPAFAGLTIFGVGALGADSRGFPTFKGSSLLTDCGAGGSPTGCADHPTYLYSPAFTSVEQFINISTGYAGLPEGVLPTPSHDHLLNTSTSFPSVEWGVIVVLVFDPNIWPDRASGTCTARVASNLGNPTANCLTSITALDAAMGAASTSIAAANGGSPGNPIWKALGGPDVQVVVPGDISVSEVNNLNSNLYIPFSVQPGAPSSFPT